MDNSSSGDELAPVPQRRLWGGAQVFCLKKPGSMKFSVWDMPFQTQKHKRRWIFQQLAELQATPSMFFDALKDSSMCVEYALTALQNARDNPALNQTALQAARKVVPKSNAFKDADGKVLS